MLIETQDLLVEWLTNQNLEIDTYSSLTQGVIRARRYEDHAIAYVIEFDNPTKIRVESMILNNPLIYTRCNDTVHLNLGDPTFFKKLEEFME